MLGSIVPCYSVVLAKDRGTPPVGGGEWVPDLEI